MDIGTYYTGKVFKAGEFWSWKFFVPTLLDKISCFRYSNHSFFENYKRCVAYLTIPKKIS